MLFKDLDIKYILENKKCIFCNQQHTDHWSSANRTSDSKLLGCEYCDIDILIFENNKFVIYFRIFSIGNNIIVDSVGFKYMFQTAFKYYEAFDDLDLSKIFKEVEKIRLLS